VDALTGKPEVSLTLGLKGFAPSACAFNSARSVVKVIAITSPLAAYMRRAHIRDRIAAQ
jgi:hypothetical protein